MLHIRKVLVALSVGALLSGCGGGNGVVNLLPVFPVQAAMQAFYTTGFTSPTLSASGIAAGSTITPGTGTEVITINAATASSTFTAAGTSLQSTYTIIPSSTVQTTSGPVSLSPVATTAGTYYFASGYFPSGYIDSNGNYCKTINLYGFPATLTAQQSGIIATYNCYSNYSAGVFSGTVSTQQLNYATFAGSSTATPPTNLNLVLTNTTYSGSVISPGQIVSNVYQTFVITSTGTNTATASLIKTESQFTSGGLAWDITFQ